MNRLAEALGMDPVELRVRNVLHEGDLLSVGTPLPKGVSMPQVVEQCAQAAGWQRNDSGWQRQMVAQPDKAYMKHGIGFACAFKSVGFSFGAPEQSWATVEIHGGAEIERAVVHHAGADVGQGAHTVIAQMAAEALGIPFEKVQLIVSDTAYTDTSGNVGLRMTFMAGNAIKGPASRLWSGGKPDRPAVATYQYRPPADDPL